MAITLYCGSGSADHVERGLRHFLQAHRDVHLLICQANGASYTNRWSNRRQRRLNGGRYIQPADDPLLHQVAQRVSWTLKGMGYCMRADDVNGTSIVRVILEEQEPRC